MLWQENQPQKQFVSYYTYLLKYGRTKKIKQGVIFDIILSSSTGLKSYGVVRPTLSTARTAGSINKQITQDV